MSELRELIRTELKKLDDYNENRVEGKHPHEMGWCDESDPVKKIVIAKGPDESMLVVLLEYDPGLSAQLGGASHRARYRNELTYNGEKTRGIVIQFPMGQRLNEILFQRLCYDLSSGLDSHSNISDAHVCRIVKSALVSLVDRGDLITESKMMGLTGELLFLKKLIELTLDQNNDLKVQNAINCWQGISRDGEDGIEETRDFGGSDVVVEVKTTGNPNRAHKISNWKQLHPWSDDEHLYVCSLGLKESSRNGTIRMSDLIREIHNICFQGEVDDTVISNFWLKLESQGVHRSELERYDLERPYRELHEIILTEITPEMDILWTEGTFMAGKGPKDLGVSTANNPVENLSYDLIIQDGKPVDEPEIKELLIRMMS